MSGNPFRKQQPAGGDAGQNGEKKKKVKKVQFVSPVASPQEPPSHPRFPSLEELDDAPKSPPPKGHEFDSIDTAALLRGDLTAGGTIDLQAHDKQEEASAANTPVSPVPPVPQLRNPPPGRRGPPANPFTRTLATMEPNGTGKDGGDAAKKPAMDVDAFKRLLLTGKADGPVEQPKLDTGSLTDASSVSRQSLSDGSKEAQPESPASSLEDASTEEEESDSEDEAVEDPVPEQTTTAIERTTSGNGPQTVSFDDFDKDLESVQSELPQEAIPTPQLPRERSTSDLNKPLPASPTTAPIGLEVPVSQAQVNEAKSPAKKAGLPPPPPTSRRGFKPASRSRSSSNVDPPAPATPESESVTAPSAGKPKPPPPRAPPPRVASRETKRLSSLQDHANSSSDSVPTVSTPDAELTSSAKLRPPPPPSRSSHKQSQSQDLKRTPSSSSSIKQSVRKVSPATGGAAAPPPPPRPRRGDKRSSIDGTQAGLNGDTSDTRRSSGMSFDRRDSVSSLQRVTEDEAAQAAKAEAEQKATNDMLADLDAFQREVDALRAKALRGK
ncbi:hypothetical protein BDZ85DRAFT_102378 [Elsinoe ampelina]|uniref:Uncharacterized protein n=1 Tax=Elsinoe ampelina TaxID=302913 RepID=A0A6A6GFI8_9PEZI|nr:hypothetical protein BDZ85DRAFT_102378 [Elsinoe ampelina]